MKGLRQYAKESAEKLAESAGKMLAAPLKLNVIRTPLKQTIKGGILIGRWSLNALEGPRKELVNLFQEADKETKTGNSPDKGKRIPIQGENQNSPVDDLSGQSRDSLYELARRYDIPGRSEMNKKELIESIRKKQSGS